MKGDGNCFYRAISYQLFGMQEEDYLVLSVISQVENLNKKNFPIILFQTYHGRTH